MDYHSIYWSNDTTVSDVQDIAAQDKEGSTFNSIASSTAEHMELACFLVEHGADLTAQDRGWSTFNPDLIACDIKMRKPAQSPAYSLMHGAVPTAQDKNGSTPLRPSGIVGVSAPPDVFEFLKLLGRELKSLKKEAIYGCQLRRQELASLCGK